MATEVSKKDYRAVHAAGTCLMARKKLTYVTGLPGLQGGSNAALNAGHVAAPRHTP